MAYVWLVLSALSLMEWALGDHQPATGTIAFAIACLAMWNCEVLRKKLEERDR